MSMTLLYFFKTSDSNYLNFQIFFLQSDDLSVENKIYNKTIPFMYFWRLYVFYLVTFHWFRSGFKHMFDPWV